MLLAPIGLLLGGLYFIAAQVVQGQVFPGFPDIGQTLATTYEVLGIRDILLFLAL